jgi:DNA repair ATPase RecN
MNFDNLHKSIQEHRQKAATFYKVDLHIHSFDSDDYPKLGDKKKSATSLLPEDSEEKPQHFIEFAKKIENLRLIAITDHNRSRVSTEIAKLSDTQMRALPGMEVTLETIFFSDAKIHILAIFPEGMVSEDIEKIFPIDSGIPNYEERDKDTTAKMSVRDFVGNVHNVGGICIAGHVNSNSGVRAFFRDNNVQQLQLRIKIEKLKGIQAGRGLTLLQEEELSFLEDKVIETEDDMQNRYLEFLSKHDFHAVEVQKPSDRQYYSGVHTDALGIKPISCVLGSDAHNLQDIGLENSTTYIKMQSPCFHDLSRALRDPGTRIRYDDSVFCARTPRVLGIKYGGGFFKEQTIGFSDNLSCLIGGRGSGKSETIEALRYLFEHELSNLTDEKKGDIRNRHNHTLGNTAVEVLYQDQNDELFVLRRDYGTSKTECFDIDGNKRSEINVAAASNLDVKVYGWGEIEGLARDKMEQLRLIDGFLSNNLELEEPINDALRALRANTQSILALVKDVEDLLPKIVELPSKTVKLELLSTPKIKAIFADYDRNEKTKSAVDSFSGTIADIQKLMLNSDAEHSSYDLEELITEGISSISKKIDKHEWAGEFQASIEKKANKIQSTYKFLISELAQLEAFISSRIVFLNKEKERIESDLAEKIEDNEKEDLRSIVNRRRELLTEVARLQSIEQEINTKQEKIDKFFDTRNTVLLPSLEEARKTLSEIRTRKIEEINEQLMQLSGAIKVSIQIEPQKYTEAFRIKLGAPDDNAPDGILKNVGLLYIANNYAEHYADRFSPSDFVQVILNPGDYSSLQISVDEDGISKEVVDLEKAEKIAKHLSPYRENDDGRYFDESKLAQLLELEHLEINDLPIIKLDGKPIENLSPGQRCSTLIPIILLESTSPLIIDQPEDNLDNRLVFDLVVDILRSLKQKRQIIVATHNPNIPVSGDAEQIIVFESESRLECDISCQGSIDDDMVIRKIKAIMEGSEDAFRIRAEKYGYEISPSH